MQLPLNVPRVDAAFNLPVGFSFFGGTYESPVVTAAAGTQLSGLLFTVRSPSGLPLPDFGASENSEADAVDMRGTVALYHFDESTWAPDAGSIKDSSGLAHDGTAVGQAKQVAAGFLGRAAAFELNACVTVSGVPLPAAQLTYATWFLTTVLDGQAQGLIARRVSFADESSYTLYIGEDAHLFVDVNTEDQRFSSAKAIEPNRWYHAAVVFDGSLPEAQRVRLYLDGALETTAAESATSLSPFVAPLSLGCLPLGASNPSAQRCEDSSMKWPFCIARSRHLKWRRCTDVERAERCFNTARARP